jgi:hypothetical protein
VIWGDRIVYFAFLDCEVDQLAQVRRIRRSDIEPHAWFPSIFAIKVNRFGKMSLPHPYLSHHDNVLPRSRELLHIFSIAFRLLACADYFHFVLFFSVHLLAIIGVLGLNRAASVAS